MAKSVSVSKSATPAKAAPAKAAPAPKAAPAKAAPATAPAAPPVGGYTLVATSCPAKGGRAERWPLLVQHAGQPGGIAALSAAIKAGDYGSATGKGMLRWCHKAGHVLVHGMAPPKAK